ncbi:S9 family peptidase [Microbacterium sp. YY-01]|uniref:S9 family peptidase n=1 Tax=Microbacterium sp. YY-01 TaxID=3421634 RepID=UPI003D187602
MTQSLPPAPRAAQKPHIRTHHNDVFRDPYDWLRDKENPEVVAHLEAENAYTEAQTQHLEPLRDQLFTEMRSRIQETDLSVPARRGDWWYYGRTQEGAQYGIQCRTAVRDADDWTPPVLEADKPVDGEEILLDNNVEAEGHEFFALGAFDISDDGNRMLWSTDTSGDELYTVHARDLVTGESFTDIIRNTSQAFFTVDGTGILYTTRDEAWRPDTLWLHTLGTSTADDIRLFHEPDDRFWLGAGYTRSRRYLIVYVGSKITAEEHLIDANDLTSPARVVWPRKDGVEYTADHAVIDGRDVLYILHNDNAQDFELVRVDASDPQRNPSVVLPHTPGQRLLDIDCFRDYATVEYRHEGLQRAGILSYSDGTVSEIEFDEPLYSAGFSSNPEWHSPFLRMGYGSFTTPSTVLELEPATGARHVRKQQIVLGGYNPDDYGQRREWATADDGTKVPISLVWKKSYGDPGVASGTGGASAGPRPLHLYGYGSYEHSIDPAFSPMRLSELDRGAIFAVAHVRGGGEMGRQWYDHGKMLHKRNTFTDFVSCARHLVDTGVTAPTMMVAEGGSAGGLLMGAVANLAPELFAGIIAVVPFVDALTSILDPSLPLTVVEWDEWGDPLHDAEVYEYMKSYTPYENVRDGAPYPPILAVTSINDTRVLYVEPAKWVARLRDAGAEHVLLKCEMAAGHGGVSGRYNAWRERAYELAWMLDRLGLTDA